MKKGQGPFQVGGTDKSGTFEFYPIPQTKIQAGSNLRITSLLKQQTGIPAGTSWGWQPINTVLLYPIILYKVDVTCIHLNSSGAWVALNRITVNIGFGSTANSGNTSIPLQSMAVPDQINTGINFAGNPDNTQVNFDMAYRLDNGKALQMVCNCYATFALNDQLLWYATLNWAPAN